jgi:hypothetical protein
MSERLVNPPPPFTIDFLHTKSINSNQVANNKKNTTPFFKYGTQRFRSFILFFFGGSEVFEDEIRLSFSI